MGKKMKYTEFKYVPKARGNSVVYAPRTVPRAPTLFEKLREAIARNYSKK